VTLLVGHFGSGKTEIALNAALDLAASGGRVTLADLDVVKPYFRSRSARAILSEAGIELLAPTGANVHADLPIIVPQIRSQLQDPDRRLIVDVGGDDVGARVLGSLSDVIPFDDTDCLLVLNFRRPATPDPERALEMIREIEAVGRVPVSGLISNTHLMAETTPAVVVDGYRKAVETGSLAEVPVVAVTVTEDLAADLREEEFECPVVTMRRIVVPPFAQNHERRTTGPLFVVN
jgi:RecA/RadA recombinase